VAKRLNDDHQKSLAAIGATRGACSGDGPAAFSEDQLCRRRRKRLRFASVRTRQTLDEGPGERGDLQGSSGRCLF
jgi:hypothetical protein